jgi:two-component system nitrate/nitrite response regulator NarL
MIDIVITSDIRIYCEGLGQILARIENLNVIDIVDNSEAAIASISAQPPQVVLVDMTMAGSCVLVRQISLISPDMKIVALAVSYDESNIMRCAEAGVICYVPREASVRELGEAIVEAAKGECYCPPKIAACILKKMQNLTLSTKNKYLPPARDTQWLESRPHNLQSRLTQRERQIARLLSEGLSNKQIARNLSIEVSTVKNHVHNVLVKLDVKSRSQAVFSLHETSVLSGI